MFPHEKTLFEQILLKDVWVEFRLYSDWCVPSSPWFGNHQCTTLTLWKCLSNFSKHYIRFLSFSDINISEHLWPIQFLAFRTNQDIVGTVEGSCDHISWYFFNLYLCLENVVRTFDLQLAGHCGLALGVLGSAGVHAAVEAGRLADLQWADALGGDLTELGVVADDHLIFHPLDLWLRGGRGEDTKSLRNKSVPHWHISFFCYGAKNIENFLSWCFETSGWQCWSPTLVLKF